MVVIFGLNYKTTAVVLFYLFHHFRKSLGSRVFVQKHNFYFKKYSGQINTRKRGSFNDTTSF